MINLYKIIVAIFGLIVIAGCCPEVDLKGQKYLVVSPLGGFANRMRAMASAHAMAQATERVLVVDWTPAPEDVAADSIDQLFESGPFLTYETAGLPPNIPCCCGYMSCYKMPWTNSGYLNAVYDELPRIIQNAAPIVYVETAFNFAPTDIPFDSFLSNYADFYRQLKPVAKIRQSVDQFVAGNFGSDMVGVHYRSWSTARDKDFSVKKSAIDQYLEAMQQALEKNSNVKFFVASDSRDAIAEFRARFGDRIVDYPLVKVDRGSLDGQINAVIEWYLLAKTDFIIGTNQSSFSDEAAVFTKKQRKIDIGPSQYSFHSMLTHSEDGKITFRQR